MIMSASLSAEDFNYGTTDGCKYTGTQTKNAGFIATDIKRVIDEQPGNPNCIRDFITGDFGWSTFPSKPFHCYGHMSNMIEEFKFFNESNTLHIRCAREEDLKNVEEITNDAFMVDAFFKKPEYHIRFTPEDVRCLFTTSNSIFLVAFDLESANTSSDGVMCGSLYLHWECVERVMESQSNVFDYVGKFSAVSVPDKFGRKGIGKLLVRAAEQFMMELSKSTPVEHIGNVVLEMGVINLRYPLFPWYEKQGFQIIGEIRPNDEELSRIILDDLDVCCILMRKTLHPLN